MQDSTLRAMVDIGSPLRRQRVPGRRQSDAVIDFRGADEGEENGEAVLALSYILY